MIKVGTLNGTSINTSLENATLELHTFAGDPREMPPWNSLIAQGKKLN